MHMIPLTPFDGPWTYAASWAFALMLGNDRATSHRTRQRITWDQTQNSWKVEDE